MHSVFMMPLTHVPSMFSKQLLDKALLDLNKQISEDERLSSNPVVKIIYGDPAVFLSRLPNDRAIHSSRIWSCKKRISVEHLAHIVQQKGGKDTVPILQKFLQKVSMPIPLPVVMSCETENMQCWNLVVSCLS